MAVSRPMRRRRRCRRRHARAKYRASGFSRGRDLAPAERSDPTCTAAYWRARLSELRRIGHGLPARDRPSGPAGNPPSCALRSRTTPGRRIARRVRWTKNPPLVDATCTRDHLHAIVPSARAEAIERLTTPAAGSRASRDRRPAAQPAQAGRPASGRPMPKSATATAWLRRRSTPLPLAPAHATTASALSSPQGRTAGDHHRTILPDYVRFPRRRAAHSAWS